MASWSGVVTPQGTTYATYTTSVFSVSTGAHTIQFLGLNPNGGTNTAFIDLVAIVAQASVANQIVDPGFEGPAEGAAPPSIRPIRRGRSAARRAGRQRQHRHHHPECSPGQSGRLPAKHRQRQPGDHLHGRQLPDLFQRCPEYCQCVESSHFRDGRWQRGRHHHAQRDQLRQLQHRGFTVTAGLHTIKFAGTNANSAFIDQVAIVSQFSDAGFETPVQTGTAPSNTTYDPSGSPWTYAGTAGVAGNGSAWGNPTAPEGSQVAFLQSTGSVSQVVTLAAGNYVITFSAAQRSANHTSQTIVVTVDGTTVGTITPAGTTYASYGTSVFTVSAGTHTIKFAGSNPTGGDNTAFLDQVALGPVPSDLSFETPAQTAGLIAYDPIRLAVDVHRAGRGGEQRQRLDGLQPERPGRNSGGLCARHRQPSASWPSWRRATMRSPSAPPRPSATRRIRPSRCWSTAPSWASSRRRERTYATYTTSIFSVSHGRTYAPVRRPQSQRRHQHRLDRSGRHRQPGVRRQPGCRSRLRRAASRGQAPPSIRPIRRGRSAARRAWPATAAPSRPPRVRRRAVRSPTCKAPAASARLSPSRPAAT